VTVVLCVVDQYFILVDETHAVLAPNLDEGGLPGTRRLELISAKPLRNGAVAMHYRRAR
jgi:hypothetical protein